MERLAPCAALHFTQNIGELGAVRTNAELAVLAAVRNSEAM